MQGYRPGQHSTLLSTFAANGVNIQHKQLRRSIYQLFGDPDAALKLHQAHLNIARQMHDKAGMGRAYGNIGNAYR